MKKRSYMKEIVIKSLEAYGARGGGFLFTEDNVNKYIDFVGSAGSYELKIKNGTDANQAAQGQSFGQISINPSEFKMVENHANIHTEGLPNPSQNLAPYFSPHHNTKTQEFDPPVFTVASNSVKDYETLYFNFKKMLAKTTSPIEIQNIISSARLSPVQFKFNPNSPLKQVLLNESLTTRPQGLRPTLTKRKVKKRTGKKKK